MPPVWHTIALDHKGPLPNGKHLLVMIDLGSRFAVVHEVKSTSFDNNRAALESTWTMLGIPSQVLSDNGPPFSGENFKNHLEYFGIKHRRTTPGWPRANGSAERFIRSLIKSITIATANKQPVKHLIDQFVRSYNSTPHMSTNTIPATLMFHRNHANTSRLPSLPGNSNCKILNNAHTKDTSYKYTSKQHYDKRNQATCSRIKIDDLVLLDTRLGLKIFNKSLPRYDPSPFVVIEKSGPLITAQRDNKTITRYISFFKKLHDNLYSS